MIDFDCLFFRCNHWNLQNHWTLEIFRKKMQKYNLHFLFFIDQKEGILLQSSMFLLSTLHRLIRLPETFHLLLEKHSWYFMPGFPSLPTCRPTMFPIFSFWDIVALSMSVHPKKISVPKDVQCSKTDFWVHQFFLGFEIWSILYSTVNWGPAIFTNLIQKR